MNIILTLLPIEVAAIFTLITVGSILLGGILTIIIDMTGSSKSNKQNETSKGDLVSCAEIHQIIIIGGPVTVSYYKNKAELLQDLQRQKL
ncbi:hypothetical protein [Desertivirga arenae]|uniref:hypothetical protein n=1 Tax=Desertivirga arenae TaxID=2810309 RepID=UPI001A96D732|nr:hypothetical protein [Pedobacter sp. SYSU D00823]